MTFLLHHRDKPAPIRFKIIVEVWQKMGIMWIAGLWLLMDQGVPQEQPLVLGQVVPQEQPLVLERRGEAVAKVSRTEYEVPYLHAPFVDTDKLNRLIKDMEKKAYREPVNAKIDNAGNIVPERNGARLDRGAFTDRFYSYFYGQGPSHAELPTKAIYSKVDSELLASIRVRSIGYYVTYFNSHNESRYHNIKLAAKAINGYVVFPGETFSFNRVVGMRTPGKGYKRAPVIVRGEFSEGVGGGICQVSSTLFNAADRAGLHIVERYSHSRKVAYVPPGRDATVNWGGPDFSFTNKYNQPVLIRTHVSPGQLGVTISSSDAIVYKQRNVPSASKVLPEEVRADLDVNRGLKPPGQ
jgi:vancomycin resistance protein YoaR